MAKVSPAPFRSIIEVQKKRPWNEQGLTNWSKDGSGRQAGPGCLKTIYVLSSPGWAQWSGPASGRWWLLSLWKVGSLPCSMSFCQKPQFICFLMKSFTHTLTTSKSSKWPPLFSFLTSKGVFEINPDAESTNLVQLLKKCASSTEGRSGGHIVDQKLQEWPFLGWCWLRISVTTLGKRPPEKARWLRWPRGLMSPCLYSVSHRKAAPGVGTVAEMSLSRGDHCPEY